MSSQHGHVERIGKMRRILSTKEVSKNRFCFSVKCNVTWHGHAKFWIHACWFVMHEIWTLSTMQKRVSDYCFCFNSFRRTLGDDAVYYKFIQDGVQWREPRPRFSLPRVAMDLRGQWRDETHHPGTVSFSTFVSHESKWGANLMVGRMNTVSLPLPHVWKECQPNKKKKKKSYATQSTKRCH